MIQTGGRLSGVRRLATDWTGLTLPVNDSVAAPLIDHPTLTFCQLAIILYEGIRQIRGDCKAKSRNGVDSKKAKKT
jgi:hypothetical protein